jgi:hypothetical protein
MILTAIERKITSRSTSSTWWGNRRQKTVDTNVDWEDPLFPTIDQTTESNYDRNDRLLDEYSYGTIRSYVTYDYGTGAVHSYGNPGIEFGGSGTEQTRKAVYTSTTATTLTSETTFEYNLQGKLAETIAKTFDPNTQAVLSTTTSSFTYDDASVRVSQTVDGTRTEYLVDSNNPTGYSQVLEEHQDLNGGGITPTEISRSYALGQEVISQSVFTGSTQGRQFLLYDGHGSTRALLDIGGDLITAGVQQRFTYDAYGNLVNRVDFITTLDQAPRYPEPGTVYDRLCR